MRRQLEKGGVMPRPTPVPAAASGQALTGPQTHTPAHARGWGLPLRKPTARASLRGSGRGEGPHRVSNTCGYPGSVRTGESPGEVSASLQRK